MSIIEVKHLTKEFNLGAVTSIKDTIRHGIARITGKQTWDREKLRALNDVSFSIDEGEVVGIIGHNGAGKSTLLKHLAHITNPTSGEVHVHGSVAPLIEVGAGINPELTGRENIFLNGAILGISKKTVLEKLDEIIAFSELEKFADTPVKRYSSGMKVKLGFAIATSMEADILIVDEVLAVGDLAFQRKCFSRIEKMLRETGKTVLIVSHNIRQVARLCSRVILMQNGTIIDDGEASRVCNIYYEQMNNRVLGYEKSKLSLSRAQLRTSGDLELISVGLLDPSGKAVDHIYSGDKLTVRIRFDLKRHLENPEIVVGTHTTDFVYLTTSTTSIIDKQYKLEAGEHEVECVIDHYPLVPGVYCIRFVVRDEFGVGVFIGETLNVFSVYPDSNVTRDEDVKTKMINVNCNWRIDHTTF
jgi:ABC-type polysaccharide/polyol phosphate transport system ATPase subunit